MGPFTVDAARAVPGPASLAARRAAAAEALAAAHLPSAAEEVWRYSPIDRLDLGAYRPAPAAPAGLPQLPPLAQAIVDAVPARSGLVVTVDGAVVHREVTDAALRVDDADEALLDELPLPHDALGQLHEAFAAGPLGVVVARGKVVREPLVVVHLSSGGGALACPRVAVRAEEGAEAAVLEVLVGGAGGALVLPVTQLLVGDAAHVRHAVVQDLDRSAWSLAFAGSRIGQDATLRSLTVALGGGYARLRTDSQLAGRHGESTLLAAYVGDGEQVHDFRTLQDHVAPRTRSELLFKGAVGGTSHGVYSGLIRVRKGAKGTAAFQTNRNLVLSETAHADSVPNLEIDENDLSCSHASAVGPIDPQQRFYLEARGVPPEVADRLIVLGFLDDVLARSPIAGVHDPVSLELARRVEAAA